MIHPPKGQKRKVSKTSEGAPDVPTSSTRPPSNPPASATSDKLDIEMSPGLSPSDIEQMSEAMADIALYFINIGWLVQKEGRGISILQPEELIRRQNMSGSEN